MEHHGVYKKQIKDHTPSTAVFKLLEIAVTGKTGRWKKILASAGAPCHASVSEKIQRESRYCNCKDSLLS
jgi:hypothetical protein